MTKFLKSALLPWLIILIFILSLLVDKHYARKYGVVVQSSGTSTSITPVAMPVAVKGDTYHSITFNAEKAKAAYSLTWMTPLQTGTQWHIWVGGKEYWFDSLEEVNETLVPLGKVLLPGPAPDTSLSGWLSRAVDKFKEIL